MIDGDQAEEKRRLELSRYARRLFATPTVINSPRSALEDIETRSQALLSKGDAARLVDKGEDSKEVMRLIERLREAVTHYQASENWIVMRNIADAEEQISQQQAVYNQITNLTVSTLRFITTFYTGNRLFHQVVF